MAGVDSGNDHSHLYSHYRMKTGAAWTIRVIIEIVRKLHNSEVKCLALIPALIARNI
jgi:hypothetical protein